MKVIEVQVAQIDKFVLCIRCPERYVLRRLIEYLDSRAEVVAHSKILKGPAIWFRTENQANFARVCDLVRNAILPLFLLEAAVRPSAFVRYFWIVWAVAFGIMDIVAAALRIIDGTGGALGPYIAGFAVVIASLVNQRGVNERTAARIKAVHDSYPDMIKKVQWTDPD